MTIKKLILIVMLTVAAIISGWSVFSQPNDPRPKEARNIDGIYIGDSSTCSEKGCFRFKDILPPKLTMVPMGDNLPLCKELKIGWCKETFDSATGTLKGFLDNSLSVQTFYRKDIIK